MSITVAEGIALARQGAHPAQICQLRSGWVVLCTMQYLRGYCILLADPLAASLNDLDNERRADFLLDMTRVGDALQRSTGAHRINYAVMGNSDPWLHAHIVPRYLDEPGTMLHNSPWAYPPEVMNGHPFDAKRDAGLIQQLREILTQGR